MRTLLPQSRAGRGILIAVLFAANSAVLITRSSATRPTTERDALIRYAQQRQDEAVEASRRAGKKADRQRDKAKTDRPPEQSTKVSAQRLTLKVELKPTCVKRGQVALIVVRTLPDTMITLMVIWPDGDPRSVWYGGLVSGDGSYEYRYTVPPDIPDGNATVSVAGSNDRANRSNYTTRPLRVDGITGCSSPTGVVP